IQIDVGASSAGSVFAERTRDVGRVLPTDTRVGGQRIAVAARAMAGDAGRNAALRHTAAIDLLAEVHERRIGALRNRLLRREVGRDVGHVLVREHVGKWFHYNVDPDMADVAAYFSAQ